MTAIVVNGSNVSASEERGSIIEWYTTNEEIDLGNAVYLDSDNEVNQAIGTSSAAANAIGIAALADNFYGETTIPEGGSVGVVVYGPVYGFTDLHSGQPLWVSKTVPGGLDDAAPTGGVYQFIVGHAQDDQTFFVDPGTVTPQSV